MAKQFDLENERAIVVSALKDPAARRKAVGAVAPEDFQGQRYRVIFEALVQCDRRGLVPDKDAIASLSEGDYGGLEFLARLFAMDPAANVEFHLERLRRDSARAAARVEAPELEKMLADRTIDHAECVQKIEEIARSLRVGGGEMGDTAEEYVVDFNRRCTEGSMFVSTGYASLDSVLIEGFSKGTISVIAGRTGHGKTSFAVDSVRRMLGGAKKPRIGVAPLEIGKIRFMDKLISSATLIPTVMFRKKPHELTLEERDEIRAVARKLTGFDDRLVVIDNPFFGLADRTGRWANEAALDKMEEILAEGGYDIFIWDLFMRALMDTSPSAIETAMARMQFMSARYGTHNCIVHQIGRKAEERKMAERRPRKTDLKGSGGLEEVPDLILLFYRPKENKPWMKNDIFEAQVAKQRDGPVGRTMLADFFPQACRIQDDRLADLKEDKDDGEGDGETEKADFKGEEGDR